MTAEYDGVVKSLALVDMGGLINLVALLSLAAFTPSMLLGAADGD